MMENAGFGQTRNNGLTFRETATGEEWEKKGVGETIF